MSRKILSLFVCSLCLVGCQEGLPDGLDSDTGVIGGESGSGGEIPGDDEGGAFDNGDDNGVDSYGGSGGGSDIPICGNGIIEGDETCDDGAANADDAACTARCDINVCGDGLVYEEAEECDMGEANGQSDACTAECTIPEV